MATNKAQDPAAAALSAIEEALNLTGEGPAQKAPEISTPIFPKASDPDKTPRMMKRHSELPVAQVAGGQSEAPPAVENGRLARKLPEIEEHPLFAPKKPERSKPDFAAERSPVAPVPAANDDRDSIGAMLRAVNKKPTSVSLIVAAVFSAIWLLLSALYFATHRAEILGSGGVRTELAFFAFATVAPIAFFLVTGVLARRAEEMRLTARSMVEVAMRLAEPEAVASEQMVTLSQAIRREIVSMGDGIERALARAGELETLVRSEVSNLERSYSDNERRIRALVEELSAERESMQANGERMRNAIGGAQDSFARELENASAGLAENLSAAAASITMSLGAKAEEIRFALTQVGDQLAESLAGQAE